MPSRAVSVIMLAVSLLTGGKLPLKAHQDPCHQRHSCPSDHSTYVCGDTGRCEQCPDNSYCLAGTPRLATSPAPMPVAPPSTPPPLAGETTV